MQTQIRRRPMKKLFCVLLVATMIIAMTPGASAAVTAAAPTVITTGIKGIDEAQFINIINENAAAGLIAVNNDTKTIRSASDLASLEVVPGDIITIQLTADMFLNSSGKPFTTKAPVSLSALSLGNVEVRSTVSVGSGSAKISLAGNKNGAYIKIEFTKSPAADGQKFTYATYLSYKGTRKTGTRLPIKGVLEAERIEVDSTWDYVDISKGKVIKALTSVKGIEIYLGEDCTITRNLVKGREYSGTVTTDILAKDEPLFTKYPDLEYIYKLQTVGLKVAGNIVTFDLDDNYYVYNTNGVYIGTTGKALPYWTTYYLSSKKYANIAVIK